MIVICEECGKKYKINPAQIKGDAARFKCKSCDHFISVAKPDKGPAAPKPDPVAVTPHQEAGTAVSSENKGDTISDVKVTAADTARMKGLGLRGKMILLFFALPIAIIAVSGLFYIWQLNTLSALVTDESARVVQQLGEDIIAESSRAVARQCKIYLDSHSDLKKEDYNQTDEFKRIAVQKLGKTGYTALYERPGEDGIWRTWAHVNSKIIGIDMSKLKKPLGSNFPGFWKVYTGVKQGAESKGYYTWQDKSGLFRDKYMVCTVIAGTPYVVAATTYLDEFTQPVKLIEARAKKMASKARNMIIATVISTLVLIGLIVAIYGGLLIRRIQTLTDIADRISIGELDVKIDIDTQDELGALARAIGRMQESIRLSIERLRRRRTM